MKRFFSTIANIFSIEELRTRILNTLGFLMVFRLGSFITLPGIDSSKLTTNRCGFENRLKLPNDSRAMTPSAKAPMTNAPTIPGLTLVFT